MKKKMILLTLLMSMEVFADFACSKLDIASFARLDNNTTIMTFADDDIINLIYPKTTYLRERDIIQTWTASAISKLDRKEEIRLFGKDYKDLGFRKVLYVFDIEKETYNINSVLSYSCKGGYIDGVNIRYIHNPLDDWEPIPPNSLVELYYQKAMEIVQTEPVNHKEDKQPRYPNFDNLGFGRTLNEP